MSDLRFGRMAAIMWPSDREELDKLRKDYASDMAAYGRNESLSAQCALESAGDYIAELERWVGGGQR